MKTFNLHPLATIFPPITGAEFEAFADDIAANGLRNPIVMLDGGILDGRNRAHACHLRGVPLRTVEYDGDDPLAFILSENLHRRHMNEAQRSLIAAKLATRSAGNPGTDDKVAPTRAQAAALLNVTEGNVEHARRVVKRGVPELVEKVERGEIKTRTAAKIAAKPPEDQRRALEAGQIAEPPRPASEPEPQVPNAEPAQIGLLSEINEWIASLAGRDVKVIPLDDRVAAARAFAKALHVIQAARADHWKPEPRAKVVNVSDASGSRARFPVERGGLRAELNAALKRPPKPPPADGDVAAFLAAGGEIRKMPTAAVGVGTGTICAEDSAALAAHQEDRDAARVANRFRNYKGSALADDGRVAGEGGR
jgi:hypothetical protein